MNDNERELYSQRVDGLIGRLWNFIENDPEGAGVVIIASLLEGILYMIEFIEDENRERIREEVIKKLISTRENRGKLENG